MLLFGLTVCAFLCSNFVAFSVASAGRVLRDDKAWNAETIGEIVRRVDMLEERESRYKEEMEKRVETIEHTNEQYRQVDSLTGLQIREEIAALEGKVELQNREISDLRTQLDEPEDTQPHDREAASTVGGPAGNIQRRTIKQGDVTRYRRQEAETNVAFLAILTKEIHHMGQFQNIYFNHVITNEGNAYNQHAGIFIAPVDGTYVFSTTVSTFERDILDLGFALNGNVITTLYVNGHENWYDSAAQTIVLQLSKGDDVSVQHTRADNSVAGNNHTLFSGFLLRESYGSLSVVG